MFEAKLTGKNKNYGKKGDKRQIADHLIVYCIQKDIIDIKSLEYLGNLRRSNASKIKTEEKVMPASKVNVEKILEAQNRKINNLIKEFKRIKETNEKYLKKVNLD